MSPIGKRIARVLQSNKASLTVFVGLVAGTICLVTAPRGTRGIVGGSLLRMPPVTPATIVGSDFSGVKLSGDLSQTKIIQGENGVVYLDLTIDTPTGSIAQTARRASDVVVVLDRSGSMSAENKLPYAKEAIRNLVRRLNSDDRFALVTFDTSATVAAELNAMTDSARDGILRQIDQITPGASTNIGDGLEQARAMLQRSESGRSKRVILLSDGEANVGVVEPTQLAKMASSFAPQGGVLSAIGMGLGFNETLMSSLADHGMGNYAYLENLATLGDILEKDLNDARNVFASASGLELKLKDGVRITDAAGYPIETASSGGITKITTGQLLSGSKKHFVLTMAVPTTQTGEFPLGDVALRYSAGERMGVVELPSEKLMIAVLEPRLRSEAVASIKSDLFRKTWLENNLGLVAKDYSSALRVGDRERAFKAISDYRQELRTVEAVSGVPMNSPEVDKKLDEMKEKGEEAFRGDANEQALKQNRAAKSALSDALGAQRQ